MEKLAFDPNAAAQENSGIFGLPYSEDSASLVYLPVPWEATTSYGGGTSKAPQSILESSKQVDLFDSDVLRPYEAGLFLLEEDSEVHQWNEEAKKEAQKIIAVGGDLESHPELAPSLKRVNQLGQSLNDWVHRHTRRILSSGKIAAVLGGDHSVPFGAFQAIAEKFPSFGILHFDAHSDTRIAYEGFTWSHASIMYNALEQIPQLTQLVQVGIRDYCEQEQEYVQSQGQRVRMFSDQYLSNEKLRGTSWARLCDQIVQALPQHVWISFDIDGLDPTLCPNTGTPVPGGLSFQEANFLMGSLVRTGKKIIGFDLNEVSPDLSHPDHDWDSNVGARILYKLSAWTLASQGRAVIRMP